MDDLSDIARRMETMGLAVGESGAADLLPDPWQPRWRIDSQWVEFECGCRAERSLELNQPEIFDPIIFRELPQQAVYDFVCDRHLPGMNKWIGFAGKNMKFDDWRRLRRAVLMRKVR